jgi:hypothetical protein
MNPVDARRERPGRFARDICALLPADNKLSRPTGVLSGIAISVSILQA